MLLEKRKQHKSIKNFNVNGKVSWAKFLYRISPLFAVELDDYILKA